MNKKNFNQAFEISEISFLSLFSTIYDYEKYACLYKLFCEMEIAGHYNKNYKLIFPEYIINSINHEALPSSSCAQEYKKSIEFFSKNCYTWLENIKKKLQTDIHKSNHYFYLFTFLVAASITLFIASCAIIFLCITQIIPTIYFISLSASILLLITSAIAAFFCLDQSFRYNGKNSSSYSLYILKHEINSEEIKREFGNMLEDDHSYDSFSQYLENKLMSNEDKKLSWIGTFQ